MIVLDTNVMSEMMRERPANSVIEWLRSFRPREVHTTIVSKAEILYGIAALVSGRKKTDLVQAAKRIFTEVFANRVLPLDDRSAEEFALIAASRRRRVRPIQAMDGLIAGTVRANGLILATRDVQDFADCGIEIVNPWAS